MKLLKPCIVYEEAKVRQEDLCKVKKNLEEELQKAPAGKIHIIVRKNQVMYYLRTENSERSGKYIPNSEANTIKTYVQKSYDEKALSLVNKELKSLGKLVDQSEEVPDILRQIYSDYPQKTQAIINPIDVSDEEFVNAWIAMPYEKKQMSEDAPKYMTDKGDHVRSKSELNIANALYKAGVPYKYECPFKLKNGNITYPDFTVLDVKNRKVVYWEHRGMMDDRDYARHSVTRIKDYQNNQIYLGDNLIITEETSTIPLGTNEIQRVIKHYLKNKIGSET